MKLLDLLVERYINLHSSTDIEKYIDDIWDIMQESYKDIGGFATAGSKEELVSKVGFAKLVRRNGRIVAASLYKDQYGRKAIAGGSDGTTQGVADLKKILYDDMKHQRAWAESSGAVEYLLTKYGGVPVSNEYAEELLGKKILSKDPDGYHYTREIGGKPYKKVIIGYLDNR